MHYLVTGNGRMKVKLKARPVVGGDCQDRRLHTRANIFSPTASTSPIIIIAQIAAAEGRHVISLDIGSADLNARMPKDDPNKLVFMALAPTIADILIDIDPSNKAFLHPNGSTIVDLDQALYGSIESAVVWYKELSTFLRSIGFEPNPYEKCILNKKHPDGQTTIAVYVDDLLITSVTQAQAEAAVDALRDKYKELKVTTGTVHNYLGMVMDFSDPPYVSINQVGMIEDIIRKTRETDSQDPYGKPEVPGHGPPIRSITRQPPSHREGPDAPALTTCEFQLCRRVI
jgi:hypothetical protein